MQEISYQYPRFERLQPRSEWRGGRLADTDLLTLEEAAGFASKHAGEEITARDFLRAAGRGEITLRAIVHRAARVRKHDGGVLFNKGEPNENIVPAGAIPTLPLSACQHLANAGRASWRTFDGFDERNGILMRYTKGMLADDEPDFETVPDDCRVVGYDVHALADEYTTPEANQAEPQAARVVVESGNNGPLPLTTGDIAFCFDGIRWNEQQWRKPLGDKPKWLQSCVAIPGQRGVSETRWNPVLIAAALVHDGHAQARSIRAKFQTKPLLKDWLEAWKTYEADNFGTQ